MGNLTRDPELRYTSGGAAVASFGLAVNRKYKAGEQWHLSHNEEAERRVDAIEYSLVDPWTDPINEYMATHKKASIFDIMKHLELVLLFHL